MGFVEGLTSTDPDVIFAVWLQQFATCLDQGDAEAASRLFAPDGHWKDLLAFTWEHKVFSGRAEICEALALTLDQIQPQTLCFSQCIGQLHHAKLLTGGPENDADLARPDTAIDSNLLWLDKLCSFEPRPRE